MRQRGFTLLEMMLVVLLIGSAASLVMMTFPDASQGITHRQLARFQAQLAFATAEGRQRGWVLGIQVRPEHWQFQMLHQRRENTLAQQQPGDRWQGYFWQIWQPRRGEMGAQALGSVRLDLQLEDPQAWPPKPDAAPFPDILLLPGGEITPFTLTFRAENGAEVAWLRVDENGLVTTSSDAGEKR